MMAMQTATDNAKKVIDELTIQYNQVLVKQRLHKKLPKSLQVLAPLNSCRIQF